MRLCLVIIALSIFHYSWCQDLSNIKNEKPIDFSGSINLTLNSYSTTRARPYRDPFLWTLSGSPTLNIYGVNLPFSFVISKRNEEFRQPFNQFGLSPSYKWVKLHLGFRSLSFSKYSLNGHVFNGVGIEATPGNWRFGAMYGKLLEPIPEDINATVPIQPTYLRKGYSFKIGYGTHKNYLDIILFKGWDVPSSIDRPTDSLWVNPQENLVLAFKTHQRLFKSLIFTADLGLSGYTYNLYAAGDTPENIAFREPISRLLKVNYSTQMLKAINTSLSYDFKFARIRLQYKRIEPQYNTMGAYFFNNDIENITISPSWTMLKRKIRATLSLGWQKNNLFETKSNQTTRRVNAMQLNYSVSKSLNVNASYTNYQVNQQRYSVVTRDVIDSLQLQQFSNNLNISVNFRFGNEKRKSTLNANFNHQSINQVQEVDMFGDNDSRSVTPSVSYRLRIKETGWNFNASANYNYFTNTSVNSKRVGLILGTGKQVSEKIKLDANTSFFNTKLEGGDDGKTYRVGIKLNFKPAEKHNFNLGTNFVKRNSSGDRLKSFSEFLGNFNYTFTF